MAVSMCVLKHNPDTASSFIRLGMLMKDSHRWHHHTDSVVRVWGICLRYVCVSVQESQTKDSYEV